MSARADEAPPWWRAACAPFLSDAAALAAELLAAARNARDELAPLAELPGPKGARALRALEILDDAIVSAEPPPAK